jgi:hypothetical protein
MSEAEARALFEADAKTLEPGSRIELSDYETGAIIEERAG